MRESKWWTEPKVILGIEAGKKEGTGDMADCIFQQWAHYFFLQWSSDALPTEGWSRRFPVFNVGSTVTPVEVMLYGFWSHKRWFSFGLVFFWRLALESSPTMLGSPSSLWGLTRKPASAPWQMSEQAFRWVTPSFKSPQLKSWFCGAERRCHWCSLPEFLTYNNVST